MHTAMKQSSNVIPFAQAYATIKHCHHQLSIGLQSSAHTLPAVLFHALGQLCDSQAIAPSPPLTAQPCRACQVLSPCTIYSSTWQLLGAGCSREVAGRCNDLHAQVAVRMHIYLHAHTTAQRHSSANDTDVILQLCFAATKALKTTTRYPSSCVNSIRIPQAPQPQVQLTRWWAPSALPPPHTQATARRPVQHRQPLRPVHTPRHLYLMHHRRPGTLAQPAGWAAQQRHPCLAEWQQTRQLLGAWATSCSRVPTVSLLQR
jgi:hypothetical protein